MAPGAAPRWDPFAPEAVADPPTSWAELREFARRSDQFGRRIEKGEFIRRGVSSLPVALRA